MKKRKTFAEQLEVGLVGKEFSKFMEWLCKQAIEKPNKLQKMLNKIAK